MAANQPSLFGAYAWAKSSTSAPVLYGSGYVPQSLTLNLADMVSSADAQVFEATKMLSDFIVLKEWVSIRVTKSVTWVNPSNNANIFDTLYGRYKFGTVLFGGLKPLASWSRGPVTKQPSVWTNDNGHKYNS